GVLHIALPQGVPASDPEVQLLTAVAEVAGSALDRAMVLETLEQRVAARTRELAMANARLQELDRLKSKFVSDVSHELRTPITNLKLYLDLLARGKPERQAYYIDVLQQQAQRLNELVEGILNLTRLEMVNNDVPFTAVALNDVVSAIVAEQQPRAEMAGLTFVASLQPGLPPVWGNEKQLAQLVTNLVSNAIRYTPQGRVDVRTRWHAAAGKVCLAVSDTGIGIGPEEKEYLFDRFYRGKQTGQSNIPGTGLGLAIVKEILDRHAGQIEVESTPGSGSTFRVWLAMASDHESESG
ncbi:MAG: hypothetical protein KC425_19680, partial [Anaerolineales bacterium]|nr:hypothetical protein [Anaerolineales bacterium]